LAREVRRFTIFGADKTAETSFQKRVLRHTGETNNEGHPTVSAFNTATSLAQQIKNKEIGANKRSQKWRDLKEK
jgi:hypothetical protein